jgi:ribose/xylose/arabinose/galactoside ABC-type transport system permease subunit
MRRGALLALVLVATVVLFSFVVPNFWQPYNIYQVVQNGVTLALLALAESIVILSGGGAIDLSVGSILGLSGMILGVLNIVHGVPIGFAIAGAVVAGAALGAINGVLVSVIRIPPLIATLATFYGYAAIALQITNTRPLPDATQPELPSSFPAELITIGQGIPFQVGFVYVPLALMLAFVLVKTVSGRYLYGVGTNALAARFSAIDVWGVRFWAYVAAGFICGLAAVVQTGLSASATPDVGTTMNLAAITIAVLGGVSIVGGEGDVLGILLASLIVIFLYNGIGLALGAAAGIWQPFSLGVLLIGSALLNESLRRHFSLRS